MKKLLFAAGALLFSAPGYAFTLIYSSGAHLTTSGWQTNELAFDLDASCDAFVSDVGAAVGLAQDLWNKAPTSALKLSIGSRVSLPSAITTYVGAAATQVAPVANPVIYCDTNFGTDSGLDANSIPGFAGAQNLQSSGKLQGALLVLNFQSGAQANLQTLGPELSAIVLAHEIGHVIGLGHSSDANALMYYSTGYQRKLILAQDDLNGLAYLYPRNEPGTGGLMGCSTISTSKPGGSGPGLGEFSLLAAFMILGALWTRAPIRLREA